MAGIDPSKFKNMPIVVPGDAYDPNFNPGATNLNGISPWQRFVVQNFFDGGSQKNRRREYLKQNGFEMGPDGESYRPIGMDADFEPIEPPQKNTLEEAGQAIGQSSVGPGEASKYPAFYKLFTPEGLKETIQDVGDVAYDVTVDGGLVLAGNLLGGAAGAAAGIPIGAAAGTAAAGPGPGTAAGGTLGIALGGIAGAAAGGAAGKTASEAIKTGIGDFFLDKSVPPDLEEAGYQSLLAGGLSVLGKGADQLWTKWKKMGAENTQKFLKEITIRRANGQLDKKIVDRMAAEPENYTPEAVQGASQKLFDLQKTIFGTDVEQPRSTRQLTGGIAREAIDPLNKRADLEIEKLADNRDADFSVADVIGILDDRTQQINQMPFKGGRQGKATLAWLKGKVEELKDETREYDPVTGEITGYRNLNFKETRDFLKGIQNEVYDKGGPVHDNPIAKQVSSGLKELADEQAGRLGSDLPQINAKRSEILAFYPAMRQTLTPSQMEKAFLGGEAGNTAKLQARETFAKADELFGLNLSDAFDQAQGKAAVEKVFNNPKAFGSGSEFSDGLREGLKEAKTAGLRSGFASSMAAGAVLPPAAAAKAGVIGGVTGGAMGFRKGLKSGRALSSPDVLVNRFKQVKTSLRDLNRDPLALEFSLAPWKRLPQKAAAIGATQTPPLGPAVKPPLAPPPEQAATGGVETPSPTGASAEPAQIQPAVFETGDKFKDMQIIVPEEAL